MTLTRALSIGVVSCALLILSACTIVSKAPLVAPEEGGPLFPAGFSVLFYTEKDGVYARNDDPPMGFAPTGTGYESADKSMTVYFVPRPDGSQLLAITSTDGNLYGLARLFDTGVLEIHMILDTDPAETLKAAPPELAADIKVSDGGIEIASRAALDYVIELVAKGELANAPALAFVIRDDGVTPPTTIIKSDGGWSMNG